MLGGFKFMPHYWISAKIDYNFLCTFFLWQNKVFKNNRKPGDFFLSSSLPFFLFHNVLHLADSESSGNRYGEMDKNAKYS